LGALVIKQPWFREEAKPVAIEDKPPVVMEEKAPVVDKANDAGPQPDEVSGKQGVKPNCDEELTYTRSIEIFCKQNPSRRGNTIGRW
jgi:hypothetical protein